MIKRAALALAIITVAGAARAEVTLAPAENGALGAWLVAGPLASSAAEQLDLSTLSPEKDQTVGGIRWRLMAEAPGALDLGKQLGVGRSAGAVALLGARLSVKEPFEGWLLLSADGAITVSLSGKRVFERGEPHLRHRSWDAVPVSLPKGDHPLLVRLTHPGSWFAVAVRLLDKHTSNVPRSVEVHLPGTDDADSKQLRDELLSASVTSGIAADGYSPTLTVRAPRGLPRGAPLPVRAELSLGAAPPLYSVKLGTLAGTHRFVARLPRVKPEELGNTVTSMRLRVSVGDWHKTLEIAAGAKLTALVKRAGELSAGLEGVVADTLSWELSELRRAKSVRDVRRVESELAALVADISDGKDPTKLPGVRRLARRSAIDGQPDPMLVHVPAGLDEKRRYPLVVALHGLNGSADGIMEAFLDSQSHAARVDGFVLAPYAHGNAFYRGPGEREVLAATDWALSHYPIDPDRVSITGVSMGGTGTAQVAFHHADRFSAAAPLCGYHSYWVRRDTSKRPLRAWERGRMDHWSTTTFADNAENLPLWIAQGTKDYPLANSRVLVERLKKLGYDVTDEWPDTGHAVWKKTYAGARLFPWLSRAKRPTAPDHVTLTTDTYSETDSFWVHITKLADRIGRVQATRKGPTRIEVSTDGVAGFALDRPAGSGSLEVVVDGTTVTVESGKPLSFAKSDHGWERGRVAPGPKDKRAGVQGPIRAVYDGPVAFVYGSKSPATRRANREVAEYFAHVLPGPDVDYPVLADFELDEKTERTRSLVLVGTSEDHSLLAEVGGKLPIRVARGQVAIGAKHFSKSGTGAIFVYPNPRHRDRLLVVVTGVDAAGIWRALSLPALLPDFLVYDEGLALAAGEQVLGRARVLAGGMFDEHWALPKALDDAPGPARD